MKVSICSIGPGLYKAIIDATSTMELGLRCLMCSVIPEPSSWKIPTVCPFDKLSRVGLSSNGISLSSKLIPRDS